MREKGIMGNNPTGVVVVRKWNDLGGMTEDGTK